MDTVEGDSSQPDIDSQRVDAGKVESKESESDEPVPLPETGISEILGLVELLKSKGGREDIYKLAQELNMEFGETITVIRSAELLSFVHTPDGDVVLEKLGEEVSKAKINKKKSIIKKQIAGLPIFKNIHQFLAEKEDHEATRDEIQEKLAELIPNENVEESFSHLVSWGRYAELFGYNDDTNTFYLDEEEEENSGEESA